ncbi:hypothetical protein QNI16_20730 [Cytophagaceae bacterium YF14B1]|uniref:Knr4/Smi1-like domain-containing protein n=1 Tax=Xanthocytophaga flava TaxID=3048013 RepID=A0AAE3QPK8_9BACT|nr:SMI1/KNR4 family protein [Xanthocytophaga flavus]MDJ1482940.1 hypothetical protein [Xanthocytophaga flavus]
MRNITEILQEVKDKWSTPKKIPSQAESFVFVSYLEEPGFIPEDYPYQLPADLIAFWSLVKSAILFKDIKYGQWGLEMLSTEEALQKSRIQLFHRPNEFREWDLVIGQFYGDLDIVFINCDETSSYFGRVYVAIPIDKRKDWCLVGENLTDFLDQYVRNEGEKYWEKRTG